MATAAASIGIAPGQDAIEDVVIVDADANAGEPVMEAVHSSLMNVWNGVCGAPLPDVQLSTTRG